MTALAILANAFKVSISQLLGGVGGGKIIREIESPRLPEEDGDKSVGPEGLEPSTHGLKVRCSTI